jgi:hypothetical protein
MPAEISRDPRQPSLFEKKRNTALGVPRSGQRKRLGDELRGGRLQVAR